MTRNGLLSWVRICLSFITLFTLRFVNILALLISFIAYSYLNFFRSTFHTLPKPPLPIHIEYWKLDLLIAIFKNKTQVKINVVEKIKWAMGFDNTESIIARTLIT